jgi:hypothetical protein
MARAPAYRSTSVEEAREQIQRRWGEDANLVHAVVRQHVHHLSLAALLDRINDRFDKLRELNEAFARAAPILGEVSTTMAEISARTASIDAGGAPETFQVPTAEDLARLEQDVGALLSAFERVRGMLPEMAEQFATEGTDDDARKSAAALERYRKRPSPETRAALRRASGMRPSTDDLRVMLVRQAHQAAARLANAPASDWAHYEIAIGLDTPCDPEAFRKIRSERWRQVLEVARIALRGSPGGSGAKKKKKVKKAVASPAAGRRSRARQRTA